MTPAGASREYETVVVFHPDMGEAGVGEATNAVKSIIAANGGSEVEVHSWGMCELAYPIKKQTRGFFRVFYYRGTGATVKEVERSLRLNDRVLRIISARRAQTNSRRGRARSR